MNMTAAPKAKTLGSGSSNAMGVNRYTGKKDLVALEREALTNAVSGQSTMNYQAIISGFMEKGIKVEDIRPRENVFTFHAWCGVGRCVRKGEHGVKICTYVPRQTIDRETGEVTTGRMPKAVTVFHISQTDPLPASQPNAAASV